MSFQSATGGLEWAQFVLELWGSHLHDVQRDSLPPQVVHAVAWHHDPDQCKETCRLSDLVHVANIAAHSIDGGPNGHDLSIEASLKAIDRLGLRPGDITTLAEETRQEMGKLKEILND